MMNTIGSRRFARRASAGSVMLGLAVAGCTSLVPSALPAGSTLAQARSGVVAPTGEYALPGGRTRLEFAQGSFGRETHMLDFDAAGRLVSKQQVLTAANFDTIEPGMPAAEVRLRLGRPAHVFNVGWQRLQVWNYRFAGADCVWFQVSIGQTSQQVTEAGIGTDPACDGPNTRD